MGQGTLKVDMTGKGACLRILIGIALMLLAGGMLLSLEVAAQSHNFHHYDTDNGLMQIQVLAVHQDQVGHIWAGSYGGVSRYNGHTFYNYTTEQGLSDNVVEAIASDRHGQVWVGTSRGLCRYLSEQGRFECVDEPVLQDSRIHALYGGADGLWVGTDQGLFHLMDGQVHARFQQPELPSNVVRSITRDHLGQLWVGTSAGLVRHDSARQSFDTVALPVVADRMITALLADEQQLWVGTERGLFRYRGDAVESMPLPVEARQAAISGLTLDGSGRLWAATSLGLLWQRDDDFELLTTANGLLYDIHFSISTDRDGLIWFGHDGGLSKWVPTAFTGYRRAHGLHDSFVRTINEDEAGRLWLGTRSGIQIVPFDKGWSFAASELITSADGLVDERVYAIDFPAPGVALIATGHGLVQWEQDGGVTRIYTDVDGLPVNQTQAVLTDSAGRTWIGTNNGTVVLEDGLIKPIDDPGLGAAYVYRFREDGQGRVWAVARTGLFIHEADGSVTRLAGADGLSDATLWDMSPDPHSGMWVGSNGDGLFHISANGDIRQFTTLEGLTDDFVWQVLVDARGQVWTYTNRGLTRFDGAEFVRFNRYDGLLHMEGGATGTWESHDGTLWFASADGLMRYDPELSVALPAPPKTILEQVDLNGSPIMAGAILPYSPGTIDFHYAALSFRAVTDLRYRFRLRGISDIWSEPIRYRPITFASLGSGSYVFEVQAILPGMRWDDAPVSAFAFTVHRAFWETIWFWSLVVIMLIVIVLLLMRWQSRRGEQHRRELEQLVQERTRELKQANRQLKDAAITDPLTGLHNRRFLLNQITKDIAQTLRAYSGTALFPNRDILFMMCDLDHFKKINDIHGHLVGDYVLRSFAELISKELRESDYMVRWGGEEFLIVARQTEASCCSVVADRVMKAIREARFIPNEGQEPLSCTCSIGISQFPFMPGRPDALSWEQVIDIADTAVYMAKREGRDRWVAIHGTEHADIESSAEFVARIKADTDLLSESGQIRIERSNQ